MKVCMSLVADHFYQSGPENDAQSCSHFTVTRFGFKAAPLEEGGRGGGWGVKAVLKR